MASSAPADGREAPRPAGPSADGRETGASTPAPEAPKSETPAAPRARALDRVLAAVAAAGLAVLLVAVGFAACAAPPTTAALAAWADTGAGSAYPADELPALAQATRAYTVDARPAGYEAARAALAEAVARAAARAAADGSPTAGEWSARARQALAGGDALAATEALGRLSDRYALDADALSHLDDCNRLIGAAVPAAAGAAALGLAALGALIARDRRAAAGKALMAAPALVIAAFAVLGLWGALDFNGLFGAFHAVLFPQGNWTFSWDSLLISMYPLAFWMGMAGTWLIATGCVAILSLVAGRRLARRGSSR
ncbi:DUF1461 domain-containing protein [Adlercreutzia faecimuris]|uniref:lipoprotein intramolecular transacylase Lit n=1 Tax=Adlercreutzia faecimuris TaxID=2897341 RepID=UPI00241289D7|nr:DUF1461 domain-containing protein [Adlercreutzia sp. JBNU-10]